MAQEEVSTSCELPGLAVNLLQRAARERSSLTASFWYGKFLQALPVTLQLETIHEEDEAVSSRWRVGDSSDRAPRLQDGGSLSEEQIHSPASEMGGAESVSPRTSVLGEALWVHLKRARETLKLLETSLSPSVFSLITTSVLEYSAPPPQFANLVVSSTASPSCFNFLLPDLTLDWLAVAQHLGEDVIAGGLDLSLGAWRCGLVAKSVHGCLMKWSAADAMAKLSPFLSWTHSHTEVLSECLGLLWGTSSLRGLLCILLTSAALERSLGDVYLTVSRASHCPSLLRDLLSTAELERVFGKPAMCLLRCLIGPPSGLNLRNLLWHGFACHDELPLEYSFLLVILVASLGKAIQDSLEKWRIVHRPYLTLAQASNLKHCFKELQEKDIDVIETLFSHSFFILPSMKLPWLGALQAYKLNRYGHCVALLLPCLEHGLRRVFACVNHCPHRAVTAESGTLYTTFDEILSPLLPDGSTNCFRKEIGDAKVEMLLDILEHSEGPRVRDRVSHGEVDFRLVDRFLCSHVLGVAMLFCIQYSFQTISDEPSQVDFVLRCLKVESDYVSVFHPVSLLRKELEKMISFLDKLSSVPMPDVWESDVAGEFKGMGLNAASLPHSLPAHFKSAIEHTLDCSLHKNCHSGDPLALSDSIISVSRLLGQVSDAWQQRSTCTLYVGRQDLELTALLRRIVDNASRAVLQVCDTAATRYQQHQERQLRTRKRNNYARLLSSLSVYWSAVGLLVAMTITAVSHFPLEATKTTQIVKFHKKILQFTENFYSQTSPTRNRWEEADTLCQDLAILALQTPFYRTP